MAVKKNTPEKTSAAPAPNDVSPEAKDIINQFATFSFGTGFIPFPGLDLAGLSALQLMMIKKLHKLHNPEQPFKEEFGKSAISTLIGTLGTQSVAKGTLGSLVKLVPGVGTIAGALTFPVFASASTRALGTIFSKHFQQGGGVVDFNPANWAKELLGSFEFFKSGKFF